MANENITLENNKNERLDSLTGIATRDTFFQSARNFIENHAGEKIVVLTSDVDRFKVVNDVCGKEMGDLLLREFADAMVDVIGGKDGVVGRIGDDVFAGCLLEKDFDLDALINRQRMVSEGMKISYNFVIHNGIYPVSELDLDVSVMCDRANLALSTIKGNYSKRYAYFDSAMRDALLAEQEVLNEMQGALDTGSFILYLQPIYSLNYDRPVSAEALVRWNHPEKGIIEPGKFIPLFEHNRFITSLDHYVWELTCRYIADRRQRGLPQLPISVNVSRVNFFQPSLADDLLDILSKYKLTPAMLRLEITESAYMDDPQQLVETSSALRKAGFKIQVDDFGSGYSSLHMLKDMPLDVLKLDMRFLAGMEPSSKAATVLLGVIRIAQSLGMVTVAEGVETKFQVEFLRQAGCDNIQGFYYAKPLPVAEFEKFMMESKTI